MEIPQMGARDLLTATQAFVAGKETEPSKDLLAELDCATFQTLAERAGGTFPVPLDMAAALRCLETLMPAMYSRVDRGCSTFSSLLDGMLSHCSEGCTVSEKHAYDLAVLALLFTETYVADYDLDVYVAKRLYVVLNAWLQTDIPFTDVPGVGELTRHFFGEPWRCLFVPDNLEHSVGHALFGSHAFTGDLVWLQRPPFLPGLCPGQPLQMSVPLPTLGMTP